MDGPQTLLITWAWERMPWIAPIPRHELGHPQVPLSNRWNRWPKCHDYRLKPVRDFRVEIDAIMSPYGFLWRPYGAWFYPTVYMKACPFPYRVMRQFGYNQTQPADSEDLGADHCIVLQGTQHHDWSDLLSKWVDKWQARE
ncbi:hypothetical protein PIB30_072196 [Stylosanthes scabra]|uniref:Uncharacterized protein n=1 Tax=Stylosanthes scabra TaxID=79078 RepID=A0ABU6YPJ2_9FABA|nr:hypothetical protein [Stylosanthes scabra]